jgi:hypothetical protein
MVADPPLQIGFGMAVAETASVLTITVTDAVLEHPLFVTVTV